MPTQLFSKCSIWLMRTLEQEYYNLSLWYFVSFISGIIFYFSLSFEPPWLLIMLIFLGSLLLLYLRRYGLLWHLISGIIVAFTFSLLISKYRILNVNTITLGEPIISKVDGTVESIKFTTKGIQIILSKAKIYKLNTSFEKIRISVPTKYSSNISVNERISLLTKLYKAQRSTIAGGCDFGFYAYFAGISATGYAMSGPEILSSNNTVIKGGMYKVRKIIYDNLIKTIGNIKGNIAAAILLGETKGIDKQLIQTMQRSGISHILCVSGLHLSLVAMIFFIASRFILNLFDFIAFNFNTKLIAAIISLLSSYCYLELTGMQIAATRAFIMTTIFILAIITERSAYPLRSIVIAAAIILCINPEYILHPSFQLSFIAVLSLVSGYEFYLKNRWILGESKGLLGQLRFYIASNIYSSFLS